MSLKLNYQPLQGIHVRLEPIATGHSAGFYEIGRLEADWAYMPIAGLPDYGAAEKWVEEALQLAIEGEQFTYALVCPSSGTVMGSTRYLNVRPGHRVLEIGYSWLGARFQRTAVNTEAKLLLLGNAFDSMGANRVELKTDSRNKRSQKAIERIGATREGILRSHMVAQAGFVRDSVMYSVILPEWPGVRDRLQSILNREN